MYGNVASGNQRVRGTIQIRGRENSDSCSIRLHLTGNKLRDVVKRSFWFSKVGFESVSLFIYRPEGAAEQVFRVVFPFELRESVPVLAKTGFSFIHALAATEELEDVVRNRNWDAVERVGYARLGMDRLAQQASTLHLATVNRLRQLSR